MPGSGDFGVVSQLLEAAQEHSTKIGKVWIWMLFVFRIFVFTTAAKEVWNDEQSSFLCDTKQPGCQLACYDNSFPISHVRFWVMQIIFVSTPTFIYLGFVVQKIRTDKKSSKANKDKNKHSFNNGSNSKPNDSNSKSSDLNDSNSKSNDLNDSNSKSNDLNDSNSKSNDLNDSNSKSNDLNDSNSKSNDLNSKSSDLNDSNSESNDLNDSNSESNDSKGKPKVPLEGEVLKMYTANVVSKVLLEIAFFIAQYYLYGLGLKSMYSCEQWPCLTKVFCYVSRPTEKTIFIIFMLLVALISLFLNVIELAYLCWKKKKKHFPQRNLSKKTYV